MLNVVTCTLVLSLTQAYIHPQLADVWSHVVNESEKISGSGFDNQLSEYVRKEMIKRKILESLGMLQPPNVDWESPSRSIIEVFQNVTATYTKHRRNEESEFDLNEHNVLFPIELLDVQSRPGVKFRLNHRLESVPKVELWISKHNPAYICVTDDFTVQLRVYSSGNLRVALPFKTRGNGEWKVLDLTSYISPLLETSRNEIDIVFESTKCILIEANLHDKSLFLVISFKNIANANREKRNPLCIKGSTECCREKLHVSFAEIGWDDWIVQPREYDAYYCKGSCASAASIVNSAAHYYSVMKKMSYQQRSTGQKLDISFCCTPTKFSPLTLIYMDSNRTASHKSLSNLVVDACGCL